jgi:2-dehydro-3-deoxy-D-arabinonate dehydratase
MDLVRYHEPGAGPRWGLISQDFVYEITDDLGTLAAWLKTTVRDVPGAIQRLSAAAKAGKASFHRSELGSIPNPALRHLLPPVDHQEVWAAGVTYERSREARQEEALDGGDVYARVYGAERPELFFKAYAEKVVGPGMPVGIRRDATWSVPEPELALVLNSGMEVIGFTIGNDLSSRDIEGANPLYLPQAKVYTASCALGPFIHLAALQTWPELSIAIHIERQNYILFSGQTHTRKIHRTLRDLTQYLGRSNDFSNGVVLLTGTGIVPPASFSLAEGDAVSIEIETLGKLTNPVQIV